MVRAVEITATALGYSIRFLLWFLNLIAAVAPPLLILYGCWLIYKPVAFIVAGLIIFVLNAQPTDRRDK